MTNAQRRRNTLRVTTFDPAIVASVRTIDDVTAILTHAERVGVGSTAACVTIAHATTKGEVR
jgi:hypothetical protein